MTRATWRMMRTVVTKAVRMMLLMIVVILPLPLVQEAGSATRR